MGGLSGRREVRMDAQKRVPPIADTSHPDALYTGTVQIHRSTPLPHRSEVKSPQFPKPSDPRFQMRFLCVRNFIPNENRKLKQYTAYIFRHNILPTPLPLQPNVRFHIGTFRREIHQAKEHILRPQSDYTTCSPFPPTSFRRMFPHVKW